MTLKVQEVFKEEYYEGILNDIYREEFTEDISGLHESLEYNEDWYNFSNMYFNYKGNSYSVTFREHTSDNVSDFEILEDTFEKVNGEKAVKPMDYEEEMSNKNHLIEALRARIEELKGMNSKLRTVKEEGSTLSMDPRKFKAASSFILSIVSAVENSDYKDNSNIDELTANVKEILEFSKKNLNK